MGTHFHTLVTGEYVFIDLDPVNEADVGMLTLYPLHHLDELVDVLLIFYQICIYEILLEFLHSLTLPVLPLLLDQLRFLIPVYALNRGHGKEHGTFLDDLGEECALISEWVLGCKK